MSSPLGGLIAEFLGYLKSFLVVMIRPRKVPQQVMHVTEVAAGSTLGGAIADFDHEAHIFFVILDRLLEQRLDLRLVHVLEGLVDGTGLGIEVTRADTEVDAAGLALDTLLDKVPVSCRRVWMGDPDIVEIYRGTRLKTFTDRLTMREFAWR